MDNKSSALYSLSRRIICLWCKNDQYFLFYNFIGGGVKLIRSGVNINSKQIEIVPETDQFLSPLKLNIGEANSKNDTFQFQKT